MEPLSKNEKDKTIGLPAKDFAYFSKLFNNVFLREFPDSYKARVSEYVDRLFFIVGGDDPIIRPDEVLQTAPAGGIHLRQIAGLRHFFQKKTKGPWFDDVIRDINSFCRNAETYYLSTLKKNKGTGGSESEDEWKIRREDYDDEKNENLSIKKMDATLKKLAESLKNKDDRLYIFRNDIPNCLLPDEMIKFHARSLHESDATIRAHIRSLQACREFLKKHKEQVLLCLPGNIQDWFIRKMYIFAPTSESAGGLILSDEERKIIYNEFVKEWHEERRENFDSGIHYFYPTEPGGDIENCLSAILDTALVKNNTVNTQPDLWILGQKAFFDSIKENMNYHERFKYLCVSMAKCFLLARSEKEIRLKARGLFENDITNLEDANKVCSNGIQNASLQIVNMSRAKFNPRFQGSVIKEGTIVRRCLTHAGLILEKSTLEPKPNS